MNPLKALVNCPRLMFQWRYFRRQTPWDTNITPPEVMEFINATSPGKALDLGCGTGTNAISLAQRGWNVTGVDFASNAIAMARQKALKAGLRIDFHVGDVTDLSMLKGPFDYILDIGCMFALKKDGQKKYAENIERLSIPGGMFMLYAWLPRQWKGSTWGITPEGVEALLNSHFLKIRSVVGEENTFPTAWYWYQRKNDSASNEVYHG